MINETFEMILLLAFCFTATCICLMIAAIVLSIIILAVTAIICRIENAEK